jgi:hypothetical protein
VEQERDARAVLVGAAADLRLAQQRDAGRARREPQRGAARIAVAPFANLLIVPCAAW